MVEFATESYQYFSKANVVFRAGIRGKLLTEVPLWIKIMMVEEGLIPFQVSRMTV